MGKKEKEKHRKKGKNDGGPFAVPRPPPRPWPAPRDAAGTPVAARLPEPITTPTAAAGPPSADFDDDDDDLEADLDIGGIGAPTSIPPVSGAEPASVAPVSGPTATSYDLVAAAAAAEGEGASLDMADIADIAPVAPTGPLVQAVHGAPPVSGVPSVPRSAPSDDDEARPTVEELTQQIRELEARLDRMLDERRATPPPPARSSSAAGSAPRLADLEWSDGEAPAKAPPTTHDLLSSDYYLRQWGRPGMRERAEEVDDFGFDPAYEERLRPFIDFLYRYYFRVDAQGTSQIPNDGRCIVVANHAGGPLPYDGLMLRAAIRREHAARRDLRWLIEDFVFYLPFVGASLNRLGAVRACQENAERLLSREQLIAVFPEGAKGIGKLFGDRYRLQRFGRGGFIRLCMRTGTPIIPCAIVGAEEANPTVYRVESLAKVVGLPYLPVTPTFPALGPVGLLPAPTKWKVQFGEPIRFTSYGPEAADDDLLVSRLAEGVRTVIQDMLSGMLAKRRSIWFG